MDTFDALGAKYDYPINSKEPKKYVENFNQKKYIIKKGGNGIIYNAIK